MASDEPASLGMQWISRPEAPAKVAGGAVPQISTNTRTSLWPERWPAIALQECIDEVDAAPEDEKAEVKWNLPCSTCPENGACLNAKRKELGPLLYDREILTNPRSSESSLFPRDIWNPMLTAEPLVRSWRPPFSRENEYRVGQAWDLAWSEKTGGDYLVCMTAYIHIPTGKKHLLNVERWQRLSFGDQCRLILTKHQQYGSDLVVIESDAAQRIWVQHMAATTPVPVMRHEAGGSDENAGKRSLSEGIPSLLIGIENRKWEIPWKPGSYGHEEVANMIDEFEAFGWTDGKLEGVGEHDDTVMCFWHLDWGLNRLVRLTDPGSEHHRGNVPGARP